MINEGMINRNDALKCAISCLQEVIDAEGIGGLVYLDVSSFSEVKLPLLELFPSSDIDQVTAKLSASKCKSPEDIINKFREIIKDKLDHASPTQKDRFEKIENWFKNNVLVKFFKIDSIESAIKFCESIRTDARRSWVAKHLEQQVLDAKKEISSEYIDVLNSWIKGWMDDAIITFKDHIRSIECSIFRSIRVLTYVQSILSSMMPSSMVSSSSQNLGISSELEQVKKDFLSNLMTSPSFRSKYAGKKPDISKAVVCLVQRLTAIMQNSARANDEKLSTVEGLLASSTKTADTLKQQLATKTAELDKEKEAVKSAAKKVDALTQQLAANTEDLEKAKKRISTAEDSACHWKAEAEKTKPSNGDKALSDASLSGSKVSTLFGSKSTDGQKLTDVPDLKPADVSQSTSVTEESTASSNSY